MSRKNYESRQESYEQLFVQYSGRVEKALAGLLIVFLAALLVSQFLLLFPPVREMLVKVEKLEGRSYTYGSFSQERGEAD
ncbi:hypothetical protein SAMN02799630_00455 [Paenibacillus sp. UNCCL117]|uniref:hypothetical protein n=1 Tax=unclassified Paenibacillus TaxID=185978 RepID=UPI00088B37FC|nr:MULTISPECIES: hypothetical protein [unclassified Paenibacillus]SDC39634.1 hypothetical protein SAMN04488602_10277 [Paenibacillus sp. cl123]SFW14042.1 hypothetical protein SAMN02799630_00455 [Paenibacillus sp. UNCCL117]